MAYHPFPLPEAIQIWTSQGGEVYELIEPVDGYDFFFICFYYLLRYIVTFLYSFHPSQIANALLGQIISDDLVTNYPDFIGAINPNNDQIKSTFGDQGGY